MSHNCLSSDFETDLKFQAEFIEGTTQILPRKGSGKRVLYFMWNHRAQLEIWEMSVKLKQILNCQNSISLIEWTQRQGWIL